MSNAVSARPLPRTTQGRPKTAPSNVQVVAQSSLMQNYLRQTPVSAGTQIATLVNADGEVEVFSLGSDSSVYWFYPDETSSTGWAQASLPLGNSTVRSIAAGMTSEGQRIVFVGNVTDGFLDYLLEDDDSPTGWGALQSLPMNNAPSLMRARNYDGQLYLAMLQANERPYSASFMRWTGEDDQALFFADVDNPAVDFVPYSGRCGMVAAITPQLFFATTDEFDPDNLYWDKNSGAKMDGAFWRPYCGQASNSFAPLGDYAQGNYDPPVGTMLLVQSVDDPTDLPLLQFAQTYSQVWNDKDSGATENGAIWLPIPQDAANYVALGAMAQRDYDPPPGGLVYCVRFTMVEQGTIGSLIWRDKNSGAKEDVAVYAIQPDPGGVSTGCFYAQSNYDPPDGVVFTPVTTKLPSLLYVGDGTSGEKLSVPAFQANAFTTTLDGQGNAQFFITDATTSLPYYLASGGLEWQLVAPSPASEIAASVDANGNLELWMLGLDGVLYHTRKLDSAWSEPVAVFDQVGLFVVTSDGDGLSQAFAVTPSYDLVRIWQDPESTNWHAEEIEVQGGQVQQVLTYTTVLTVTDGDTVPLPNAAARVWASDPLLLTVNGGTYQADSVRPANVTTNSAGQIILTSVTDSLSTALLSVWVAPMSEGDAVVVEPNAEIQARLVASTAAEVMDAQDRSGNYLLSGDYRTQNVAQSLATGFQQCMTLAAQSDSPPQSRGMGPMRSPLRRYHRRLRQARRAKVYGQSRSSWVFGAPVGAPPTFLWFTDHEREDFIGRMAALPRAQDALNWLGDLGDLLEAARDGAVDLVNVAVVYAQGAVDALVELVIDGISYVFQSAVSLVEQAFDLIELLWARVQVTWDQISEWLAFFFDWDDIQLTQQAITYSLQQLLAFLTAAVPHLETWIDGGIQQAGQQIQQFTQGIIQQIGAQTIGESRASITYPDSVLTDTTPNNIFLSAFLNGLDSNSAALAMHPAPAPSVAVSQVFRDIATYLEQLGSSQAIENAVVYFQNACSSTDQFLQNTLAGLVSLFEAVAEAALAGANAAVNALLGVLSDLLTSLTELLNNDIGQIFPFIGELYGAIFGGTVGVSYLDLLSITVAIPATLAYKAMFGDSPFSEGSLSQLQQVVTASNLLAASGFEADGTMPTVALNNGALEEFQQVYQVLYGTTFLVYSMLEPFVDVMPPGVDPPLPLSVMVMGLEFLELIFDVPWVVGVPDGPAGALTIWNWGADIVAGGFDLLCLVSKGTLATNLESVGPCFNLFIGGLDLGLGLGTSILTQDATDGVADTFSALTDMFKFGRKADIVVLTEGISLLVTAAVDTVGDAVVCSVSLMEAQNDPGL